MITIVKTIIASQYSQLIDSSEQINSVCKVQRSSKSLAFGCSGVRTDPWADISHSNLVHSAFRKVVSCIPTIEHLLAIGLVTLYFARHCLAKANNGHLVRPSSALQRSEVTLEHQDLLNIRTLAEEISTNNISFSLFLFSFFSFSNVNTLYLD